MGTWGSGPFENDTAADWCLQFEEADLTTGLQLIEAPLRSTCATADDDFLDADLGAEAVASAEVVAGIASQDFDRSSYSDAIAKWIDRTGPSVSASLVDLVRRALERVTAENSELTELWEESGSEGWGASIASILSRLNP